MSHPPTVLSPRAYPTLLLVASCAAAAVGCSGNEAEPQGRAVPRLVYAVRQHTVVNGDEVRIDVAGGAGQVMEYLRYVPGGRLELRDVASGSTYNLTEDFPEADVSGLDVSYDATRVVFSMKEGPDDGYHIYWAALERGSDGKFEIHKVTSGDFDDVHPVWLAGDRIAFVTNQAYTEMGTRADEYNHGRQVTQLAVVSLDGGERRLCSQNLSHTIDLFAMSDGRIGYSRWEHFENVNDVKLFATNPDCTQMVALAGQHGERAWNSFVQVAEANTPNTFLAVVTSRENTLQAGALLRIDARAGEASAAVDEEHPVFELLTDVPTDEAPSSVGRYRTPVMLPDGRILASWAGGFVNEQNELSLTPPDFGVYVFDPATRKNQLVVNHEDSWELYARPVVTRPEPPPLSSVQASTDPSVPAVFGSIDIKRTSLSREHGNTVSGAQFAPGTSLDEALGHAVRVRLIEGFSTEGAPGAPMFGLTMAEGAALLGEAEVYPDGSWLAAVPPYIPIHVQPVDEFDLAIRNQTTWIQGMPGEARVCGGCHERRTEPNIPAQQGPTLAALEHPAGQDFMRSVAERDEYPWSGANDPANSNQIQPILDAYCVSCHNETEHGGGPQPFYELVTADASGEPVSYRVPRLDLSSRPVTIVYERELKPWPASYVSLFYPAVLGMEMGMGGLEVKGEVPPRWAVPSDARHSALIEKLNVTSSRDPARYAWPLGEPFSDPAIAGGMRSDHAKLAKLPREELVKLIRAIDLGGQYYSRQNTAFSAYASGPLTPGQEY